MVCFMVVRRRGREIMAHDYITIDMETRSEIDLTKVGSYKYSQHPTTQIICMAYKIKEGSTKIWKPILDEKFPGDLRAAIADQGLNIEAHNMGFEKSMWDNVAVPKLNAPPIDYDKWRCSMAKAASNNYPQSLEDGINALDLGIDKDMSGHRVMLQLCAPRRPSISNPDTFWEPHTASEKFDQLYDYCINDVNAEVALSTNMPDMSDYEFAIWQMDRGINDRGLRIDLDSVRRCSWCVERLHEHYDELTHKETEGVLSTVRQNAKFMSYLKNKNINLPNLQGPTLVKALGESELHPGIHKLIKRRIIQSKTTAKKLEAMVNYAEQDDKIRGSLRYGGAIQTLRWSGKGFQPQNMTSNIPENVLEVVADFTGADIPYIVKKYENPLDTAANIVRPMIIPSKGKKFFCADFTSIELLILFWFSGGILTPSFMDKFNQDKSYIYRSMAARIYGKNTEDVVKGSSEYTVGKSAVLGLGYGMGWKKFVEGSLKKGSYVSESEARRAVRLYRNMYHPVTEFWAEAEKMCKIAIRNPDKVFSLSCGVKICVHDDSLNIKLLSGRVIRYRKPELQDSTTSWGAVRESVTYMGFNRYAKIDEDTGKKKSWDRLSTYGAKIVQHIIQSTARDLMVYSMFSVEDAGYDIVLTIHDEILAEKNNGSLEEFQKLMSSKPTWAEACQVTVTGWTGERYRK